MHYLKSAVLVFLLTLSSGVAAHQYHFGLTEISINTSEQTLEVVHKYFIRDIAQAVNGGTDIAVEEEALSAYVQEHFAVAHPEAGLLELNWIGAETDIRYVWVYQSYDLKSLEVDELIIQQRILLDTEPDQVNTITTMVDSEVKESYTLGREVTRAIISF